MAAETPARRGRLNGRTWTLVALLAALTAVVVWQFAARELSGSTDYDTMAQKLLKLGPKLIAITMGGEGCLMARAEKISHVPSFKVNVVDTTGAGDAFMGGLSYALLQGSGDNLSKCEGWDDERVGRFANACAALCCTKVGARAMSRLPEVNALIGGR